MEQISIVVPVYNKAWCLARCVDSVLAQSRTDFSLILVDDGSKDNSLELCRNYESQDSRVHVIAKPNGGVSSARNAGIDASSGKYLVFLDADEWWEPDFLETMIGLAEQCGDRTLPICGMFYSSSTEQPVLFAQEAETILSEEGIYDIYRKHFLNMLWNKVFLGDVVRQGNIRFPEGIHWGEDKLFILKYLENITGYHIIGRPLYHYSVSDTGLDRHFKADELQLNEMLHRALFAYTERFSGKYESQQLMLCAEYIRVQVEGAMRQIRLGKSLRWGGQLRNDRLLTQCMEQLRQAGILPKWMCRLQKSAPLLLIFCYAVRKKLGLALTD